MSTEIATQDSPREAARERLSRIRGSVENQKRLMLEAWEAKDHLALGYTSWDEYAEREFGYSRGHFYRCLVVARGERIVEAARIQLSPDTIAPGQWDAIMVELMKIKGADGDVNEAQFVATLKEAIASAPHVAQKGVDSRFNTQVTAGLVRTLITSKSQKAIDAREKRSLPQQQAIEESPRLEFEKPDGPPPSAFDVAAEQNLPVETTDVTEPVRNTLGVQPTPAPESGAEATAPKASAPEVTRVPVEDEWEQTPMLNIKAASCQRDDEKRCLVYTATLPNGQCIALWAPYGLLPMEFLPR